MLGGVGRVIRKDGPYQIYPAFDVFSQARLNLRPSNSDPLHYGKQPIIVQLDRRLCL